MSQPEPTANPYASPAPLSGEQKRPSEAQKAIFRTAKFVGLGILALIALRMLGILGIVYRRPFDNEPLRNPVLVVRNNNDELQLADGQLVTDFWRNDDLAELMKRTGSKEVELAPSELGPGKVDVVAKDFQFICGVGDPMFTLPIIPMRVPRYKRVIVGNGQLPVPSPSTK